MIQKPIIKRHPVKNPPSDLVFLFASLPLFPIGNHCFHFLLFLARGALCIFKKEIYIRTIHKKEIVAFPIFIKGSRYTWFWTFYLLSIFIFLLNWHISVIFSYQHIKISFKKARSLSIVWKNTIIYLISPLLMNFWILTNILLLQTPL